MRQIPASLRTCGTNNPAAPRSSNIPVTWTISIGRGKYIGIIRARSVYPQANIPVGQLSIDETQPPLLHHEICKRLALLREEGDSHLGKR